MDNWNPLIAKQHVKRVRFWQELVVLAASVFALVFGSWAMALFLLSLERVS